MTDDAGFRYVVQVYQSRRWNTIAAFVSEHDGIYLAETYQGHDQTRSRVLDVDTDTVTYNTRNKSQ